MIRPVLASLLPVTALLLTSCMTAGKPPQAKLGAAAPAPTITSPKPACNDINFPIYFRSGSADLTDPALEAIRAAAAQSKGCQTNEVRVLGLADAGGSADVSQAVSEDRARAVAKALAAQGFPVPAIEASASGKIGATTAGGAAAPQRRRAEVAITFRH